MEKETNLLLKNQLAIMKSLRKLIDADIANRMEKYRKHPSKTLEDNISVGLLELKELSDREKITEAEINNTATTESSVGSCKAIPRDTTIQGTSITVMFSNACFELTITEYDDAPTLDNLFQMAKEKGYTQGTIFVIAENSLNGTIYQYGNHGPYWETHGQTKGYA